MPSLSPTFENQKLPKSHINLPHSPNRQSINVFTWHSAIGCMLWNGMIRISQFHRMQLSNTSKTFVRVPSSLIRHLFLATWPRKASSYPNCTVSQKSKDCYKTRCGGSFEIVGGTHGAETWNCHRSNAGWGESTIWGQAECTVSNKIVAMFSHFGIVIKYLHNQTCYWHEVNCVW